jgi:hypothetical protein
MRAKCCRHLDNDVLALNHRRERAGRFFDAATSLNTRMLSISIARALKHSSCQLESARNNRAELCKEVRDGPFLRSGALEEKLQETGDIARMTAYERFMRAEMQSGLSMTGSCAFGASD